MACGINLTAGVQGRHMRGYAIRKTFASADFTRDSVMHRAKKDKSVECMELEGEWLLLNGTLY